jgi:hypothetical protein
MIELQGAMFNSARHIDKAALGESDPFRDSARAMILYARTTVYTPS